MKRLEGVLAGDLNPIAVLTRNIGEAITEAPGKTVIPQGYYSCDIARCEEKVVS